jgi:hypothetical protein
VAALLAKIKSLEAPAEAEEEEAAAPRTALLWLLHCVASLVEGRATAAQVGPFDSWLMMRRARYLLATAPQ